MHKSVISFLLFMTIFLSQAIHGECQKREPCWLDSFVPFFDYRLRYQWEKISQQRENNLGIYRLIAGFSVKPQDNLELVLGTSTGGDNPRTTNTNFAPTWNNPQFRLNLASVIVNPNQNSKLVAGKFQMNEVLWSPAHMLWDSDINPIGGGGSIKKSFSEALQGYLRGGYFTVREIRFTRSAPQVLYTQAAFHWSKAAYEVDTTFSFYSVPNATHNVFPYSSDSNTKRPNGKNRYQFNSLSPALEFGTCASQEQCPSYLGAFIESIHNVNPSRKKNGFIVGLKAGQKKRPIKKCEWLASYSYRWLEKDAWMDTFPNQRFFLGRTNVKGHKLRVEFAPVDHVVMAFTYSNASTISGQKLKQQLLQFDCGFVF